MLSNSVLEDGLWEQALIRNPLIVTPKITISDALTLMSSHVSTCYLDEIELDSHLLFTKAKASCLLVVEGKELVGILTERDIVRLSAKGVQFHRQTVGDVMTKNIITLRQSDATDLLQILNLFQRHRIRHLPVLDDHQEIIGLLSHATLHQILRPAHLLRLRQVAEVMMTQTVQALPTCSVRDVTKLMATHWVSSVILVEEKTREDTQTKGLVPVGLVTEGDIVQFQALGLNLDKIQAKTVMSFPVFSVGVNDSLWDVRMLMYGKGVSRVVVTSEEGFLLGIVTQTTLLQAINPLEVYQLVELLEKKLSYLEAEKLELIVTRNQELEHQVKERTQDLTNSMKRDQLLTQITNRIRATLDLENILQITVTEIREFLDCDRMVVCQLYSGYRGKIVAESISNWNNILGIVIQDDCFQEDLISYYSDEKIHDISNIYQVGYPDCYVSFLEDNQVRACVIVPLFINDKLWGLLIGHQCDHFRQWQNTEIDFLDNVAQQLVIAIHQAQLFQEKKQAEANLRQLNQQLEEKIQQRTEELQEREAKLQNFFDNAPDLIQSVAPDGRILFVNKTWRNLLGYTEADLENSSIFDIIHPDCKYCHSHCQQVLNSIINGNSGVNLEVQLITKQGKKIWVEGNLNGVYKKGKLIQSDGIFREITERKEADKKLQQTLKELSDFKSALDQSAIVAITDEKGTINYANDRFCEISQYSQEELIGKTHSLINSHYHSKEFFTALWQTISRGEIWRGEIRNKAKDGSYYWVDSTIIPFLNSSGKPTQYLAIRNDITQKKKTEETLKQKLAAIEASIDGIAILAGDTYTYLNQAHLKLFGYQHPKELVGKSWQQLYSKAELQRLEQEVFPILIQQGHWRGEATAQRKDGSTFTEELSLTLTEDGNLICVCRDISERKQAEKQLRQTNERLELTNLKLERATRAKDEFLANMSHELRTPLNAVIGMSEGLQEEVFGSITPDQQKAIGIIEVSGQHLLDLINDILDLSKIEAGKLEVEISSVSLTELLEQSLIFVRQPAMKKQIKLTTEIAPELNQKISVDQRRMRQVLINLLSNAIKFTPEGGEVTLTAELESEKTNSLKISVKDTGIGIASENLDKLFQPFVQLDSRLNRQYTGTGLGLALVRQIVELHQGEVSVSSQLGEGSCFSIYLPYSHQNQVSISEENTSVSASQTLSIDLPNPPEKSSSLLLLAEDNQANIDTVYDYLTSYNYQLIIAKNGREAVEMSKQHQPNLILMDIQMPEMDGLEAIRQIRTNPSLTQIPIIAVTALAMAEDVAKCREVGANELMTKPLKLKKLLGMIQNLLN